MQTNITKYIVIVNIMYTPLCSKIRELVCNRRTALHIDFNWLRLMVWGRASFHLQWFTGACRECCCTWLFTLSSWVWITGALPEMIKSTFEILGWHIIFKQTQCAKFYKSAANACSYHKKLKLKTWIAAAAAYLILSSLPYIIRTDKFCRNVERKSEKMY